MAQKKKKTQLKPHARGFATTSVPKKVIQAEEATPAADEAPASDTSSVVETGKIPADRQPTLRGGLQDSEKLSTEQQFLQSMVDRHQEKTEKEISRSIKAIEVDKRAFTSGMFNTIDVDPLLVDGILCLHLQEETSRGSVWRSIDHTKEKAVVRLALTYGILRRLGFSEDWVEQCLRAISGIELDEALDWLIVHCPDNEVESEGLANGLTKSIDIENSGTPAHSQESLTRLSGSEPIKREGAPTGVNPANTSSERIPPEIDDPNMEYAQIKLRLVNFRTSNTPQQQRSDTASLLEERLRSVKSHYFFDERDAERLYRSELEKASAQLLQATLRGSLESLQPQSPKAIAVPMTVAAPSGAELQPDLFDEEDEGSSGGLLDILEAPVEVEGPRGTMISVKDMSFRKQSRERLPHAVLLEYVSKADRYAAVTFNNISGHSRAKRASVRVLWSGRKVGEWKMEDIACQEDSQAENYIATIALHAMSFLPTAGFAVGSMNSPIGNTFFKLFPPVFRDLWDELEADRKTREGRLNREIWAKLWSIVGQRIDANRSARETTNGSVPSIIGTPQMTPLPRNIGVNQRLIADLRARQSRPAYQEMLMHRNTLPIANYREDITSTLENAQVLVLCGETGCGKSTQVPAFILENQLSQGQPCNIYCTQPRRISAVSLAQRVSRELGDLPGTVGTINSLVGYAIRLESNTTKNTRLTYITTGIALRMLERGSGRDDHGTAFDEVTHLIIDEVHERTIESDFLLVVLKSLLLQRPDLRVILMSATVDSDKISRFFGGCPVIHVPGRTFPVDVFYLEDAIEHTGWSMSEDSPYAKRGHSKFHQRKNRTDWDESTVLDEDDDMALVAGESSEKTQIALEKRYSTVTERAIELLDERAIPYDLIIRLLENFCFKNQSLSFTPAVLVFMPGLAEIRRMIELLSDHPSFGQESLFRIYPLHSTLSSEDQNSVFDTPPAGTGKIVVATNIAETGITIPDITCVIDTGKQREIMFDEKRQLSRLVATFVAKSNAAQRRGRAGRVQNGICYHLFTKRRHDTLASLADHPLPEMMRLSLSDLALRIKTMKVKIGESIEDVLCHALDPPTPINVQRAIAALVEVRALTPAEEITPMGRLLSKLPTDVHLGKLLLIAVVFRCLDPVLTVAAALSSKSPFVTPLGLEEEADRAKKIFCNNNSDFLTIHSAFAAWRRSPNQASAYKFCRKNFLSHENLLQIEELRQQFLGYLVDSSFVSVDVEFVKELSRARFGRSRYRFVMVPPELDSNSNNLAIVNAALLSGLYPKLLCVDVANGFQMHTLANNRPAFFHPSSVNFRSASKEIQVAKYLVYFTLVHSKKLYAWETAPVDDLAILLLCGECDFKLMSDTAIVDRKVKYRLPPRANVAMKILRNQLSSILAQQFRGRPLTESQVRWHKLAMVALGRTKLEEYGRQARK